MAMVNISVMVRGIIKSKDGSWPKTNTLAVTIIRLRLTRVLCLGLRLG
jgi:hypothetical protein